MAASFRSKLRAMHNNGRSERSTKWPASLRGPALHCAPSSLMVIDESWPTMPDMSWPNPMFAAGARTGGRPCFAASASYAEWKSSMYRSFASWLRAALDRDGPDVFASYAACN